MGIYQDLYQQAFNPVDPAVDPEQEKPEDDRVFTWKNTLDASVFAMGRGILSAFEGALELPNIIPGVDYDIPENLWAGNSKTVVGGLVEGFTQFLVPFVGVGGRVASGVGRLTGVSQKASQAALRASARGSHGIAKTIQFGQAATQGAVGGALVDFVFFDGLEGRLADLANRANWSTTTLSKLLATDEDDSQLEGRLKNLAEGAMLGGVVDSLLYTVKAGRIWHRNKVKAKGNTEKAHKYTRHDLIKQEHAKYQTEWGLDENSATLAVAFKFGLPDAVAMPNRLTAAIKEELGGLHASAGDDVMPDAGDFAAPRDADEFVQNLEEEGWMDSLLSEYMATGQAGTAVGRYGQDHSYWFEPKMLHRELGHDPKEVLREVTPEAIRKFAREYEDVFTGTAGNKYGIVLYQEGDKNIITIMAKSHSRGGAEGWSAMFGGGRILESHRSADLKTADWKPFRGTVEGIPLPAKGKDILSETDGRKKRYLKSSTEGVTPARAFMGAVGRQLTTHRVGRQKDFPTQEIWVDVGAPDLRGIDVDMDVIGDNQINISDMRLVEGQPQGTGGGTKVLKSLMGLADTHGVELHYRLPSPNDKFWNLHQRELHGGKEGNQKGYDRNRILNWLVRLGFDVKDSPINKVLFTDEGVLHLRYRPDNLRTPGDTLPNWAPLPDATEVIVTRNRPARFRGFHAGHSFVFPEEIRSARPIHVGTARAAADRGMTHAQDGSAMVAMVSEFEVYSKRPLLDIDGDILHETSDVYQWIDEHMPVDPHDLRVIGDFERELGIKFTEDTLKDYESRLWSELLRDSGYDAIPYRNRFEDADSVSWIVLDPRIMKTLSHDALQYAEHDGTMFRYRQISQGELEDLGVDPQYLPASFRVRSLFHRSAPETKAEAEFRESHAKIASMSHAEAGKAITDGSLLASTEGVLRPIGDLVEVKPEDVFTEGADPRATIQTRLEHHTKRTDPVVVRVNSETLKPERLEDAQNLAIAQAAGDDSVRVVYIPPFNAHGRRRALRLGAGANDIPEEDLSNPWAVAQWVSGQQGQRAFPDHQARPVNVVDLDGSVSLWSMSRLDFDYGQSMTENFDEGVFDPGVAIVKEAIDDGSFTLRVKIHEETGEMFPASAQDMVALHILNKTDADQINTQWEVVHTTRKGETGTGMYDEGVSHQFHRVAGAFDTLKHLIYLAGKEDGVRPDAIVSLLIHERGHAIRHILLNPRNGHFTIDQVEAIEKAFGVKDGVWTEGLEEQFAEAFVHFFRRNLAVPAGATDTLMGEAAIDDGVRNLFFSALAKKLNETGDLHQRLYLDPDFEMPDVLQKVFNELANKSDMEAVAAAVGTDAVEAFLNRGARRWLLASSQGATRAEQRMDKFRQEMDAKHGKGWERSPWETLDERDARRYRTNLTILDNEDALLDMGAQGARPLSEVYERQAAAQLEREVLEEEVLSIAEVTDLDAVRLRDIEDPGDRATVKEALRRIKEVDDELKLYEQKLNPRDFEWERAAKEGVEGADRPRSLSSEEHGVLSALHRVDEMDNYERGLDLFSDDQRMMERELLEHDDEIKRLVMEKEAKYVKEFYDASGNARDGEQVERFLNKVTDAGIKFTAGVRVVRNWGNAVVMRIDETLQEYRGATTPEGKREALANFLYYYGFQKELMRRLKANERLAGMALQSHNKGGIYEGFPTPHQKITDAALQQKMIDRVEDYLNAKGLDLETFITRVEAVTDEGILGAQRNASALHQSRFDPFMELWYNSLLSGTRTQRVNMDGNIIWGILNKFSRSTGRMARRLVGGGNTKTVGLMYSLWHNHKAAWQAAVRAFKHGSPQLDPHRYAVFDSVTGAFDGASTIASGRFAQAVGVSNKGFMKPIAGLINGLAKVIGVNAWPTKMLGSVDEYFKQIHYRGMLREQLLNDGISEGLTGHELAKWVDDEFQEIILNGTKFDSKTVLLEEYRKAVSEGLKKTEARERARKIHDERYTEYRERVSKKALDYARFSTFTNENAPKFGDNPISTGIQSLGRGFQNLAKDNPWLRLFIPFINTPANLLSIASDYAFSPIFDTGKFGNRIARNLLGKEVQQWATADDRALGRLAISSASIFTIALATQTGVVSGGGPVDPARRQTLMDSGWRPYSVRVGDKWISYGRLDPVASVISIVADMVSNLGDDPYLSDPDLDEHAFPVAALYALSLAVARNLGEKSFMAGFIKMNAAISNPEFYSQNLVSDLGSTFIVPNLVNQIGQEMDPTLRETRTLMDKIRYRTPFLRSTLDPKRNVLGEPLGGYDYSIGPSGTGLLNPYSHSSVTHDPVRRELAMYGKGITPPQSTRYGQVDMEQYKNRRGQNSYDRWLQLHGQVRMNNFTLEQALRREIRSQRYRRLAPMGIDGESSPRMDALKKIIFRYRAEALRQVQREYPNLGTNLYRAQQNAKNRRLGRPEQALIELLD